MLTKLQELTDRLYQEGLSKGQAEGEEILGKAREEARQILDQARKEARDIVESAKAEALDYKTKIESDLKMAASQSLLATRQDIENLIVAKLSDTQVKDAMTAPEFVQGIITAVAQKFSAEGATDLSLVLPASMQAALEPFVKNQLGKVLGSEVQATFSKKISGGFTIGPKDGGWFVSMTDETFSDLISSYLRPATKKLLFG